ncbi:unnamed protein product, partial [Staurois parvus]
SAHAHCFSWLYSTAIQSSVITVKHKHTQHTVNPLITPMSIPSCPAPLVQWQCYFFSSDHCTGVTEDVSDTKLVPPSVRMPAAVLL